MYLCCKVETTLDAYIWFTLDDGQPMPEFVAADLCRSPPVTTTPAYTPSYTPSYPSTSTDSATTTTTKIPSHCEGYVDYKMRDGKVKIVRSGENSKTLRLTQSKESFQFRDQ